jgi:hypothetical protein
VLAVGLLWSAAVPWLILWAAALLDAPQALGIPATLYTSEQIVLEDDYTGLS